MRGLLEALEGAEFDDGERIIAQGEMGDMLYVVVEGGVVQPSGWW